MPWKEDENKALVRDEKGDPIWISESGEDKAVDYPAMSQSLGKANREAAERKEKLRALEARYASLNDIEDLEAWRAEAVKALETVKAIPDKDKAVEERIRAQVEAATKPLKEQMNALEQQKKEADARLQREAVSNAFNRSVFVREKMVDPVLASDLFSKHFRLGEDGGLEAQGPDGQPIWGESGKATFDEALAKLVETHPSRAHLLKGSPAGGSGASPGGGKPSPGGKTMRRADFEALDPAGKAKAMADGTKLTD